MSPVGLEFHVFTGFDSVKVLIVGKLFQFSPNVFWDLLCTFFKKKLLVAYIICD